MNTYRPWLIFLDWKIIGATISNGYFQDQQVKQVNLPEGMLHLGFSSHDLRGSTGWAVFGWRSGGCRGRLAVAEIAASFFFFGTFWGKTLWVD